MQPLALAAGCRSIAVHRDLAAADAVFEVERWSDRATHEAFTSRMAAQGVFAPFDELLARPIVVVYGAITKHSGKL